MNLLIGKKIVDMMIADDKQALLRWCSWSKYLITRLG